MDPDRVRAYLQISCAGLGFDIGELWWTSTKDGGSSSALAAIEEKKDSNVPLENQGKKLRFVQLYTSKSYEARRPMLVRPTDEEENYNSQTRGSASEDSSSDLEKHVLSPTLVDAISKTAQVVWAHTKKTEGLTGRSDIRLQTAVGMPVAVDKDGNMCVVVMFSPNNIQSTDNALEYLQSISRSATSSSIPCLLPAFDPKQGLISLQHHNHHSSMNKALPQLSNILTDGVITRFVPLDEKSAGLNQHLSIPEVHGHHDLESAPRDCFGIPMLPAVAELGNSRRLESQSDIMNDAFDEASYGVWSTIMQNLDEVDSTLLMEQELNRNSMNETSLSIRTTINNQTYSDVKPIIDIERQERLEEFASAFLDVSIFDLAEIWTPTENQSDYLCLKSSVKSIDNNKSLDEFSRESKSVLIKFWSGAVGRAYSSGNPVWSFKQDIFSDPGRVHLFRQAKIETVLAVPVFSGRSRMPAFIFCCYSFVRSGSIPFVLKFVQQALKLLWGGLDNVEPHESVDEEVWKHVAPADLGEMAADVEMHQHFMIKKRPIGAISTDLDPQNESVNSLTAQVDSLKTISGTSTVPSIYTGQGTMENSSFQHVESNVYEGIQTQLYDAIKSVADMKPAHHHVATNANGSKRAHVLLQEPQIPYTQQQSHVSQELQYETIESHTFGIKPGASSPLPLPQPFRLPNQVLHPVNNEYSTNSRQDPQIHYQLSQQQTNPQFRRNATQNQPSDYNFDTGISHSYSIMQGQQQTPQKTESSPVPTQVYSLPMEKLNAASTIVSVSATTFTHENTDSVESQMRSPKISTTLSSSDRSTANVSNTKSCRIQGCDDPALARRPYCVRHSGNRMCEHKGCSKCAQGSTRFCIAHGGGRRCTYPGCDKGARDKFFCAAHGGGKRCKNKGCNKSAVGGSNLCTAHGGGRRCAVEGCDKSAQSSTKFCVKHGGGKKCSFSGCEKVSRGRTQFCAAHGGGVRCKLAGCNRVAIGKVQLCRAHGGGARPKQDTLKSFPGREVRLPMTSAIDGMSGSMQGTFCVPIIEPVMDIYDGQQAVGTDFANI